MKKMNNVEIIHLSESFFGDLKIFLEEIQKVFRFSLYESLLFLFEFFYGFTNAFSFCIRLLHLF